MGSEFEIKAKNASCCKEDGRSTEGHELTGQQVDTLTGLCGENIIY